MPLCPVAIALAAAQFHWYFVLEPDQPDLQCCTRSTLRKEEQQAVDCPASSGAIVLAVHIAVSASKPVDQSVQVQDKALDVLSQHLSGNREVLHANVNLILRASERNAVSVRKRAVDILWACYINCNVYGGDVKGRESITALLVHSLRLFGGTNLSAFRAPCFVF
jgi:hypothetical protein